MLRIQNSNLLAAAGLLGGAVGEWRMMIQVMNGGFANPHPISNETKVQFLKSIERIRDVSVELGMVASRASASRAFDECLDLLSRNRYFGVRELQQLISHVERVIHVFSDEMRERLVFVMPPRHSEFFDGSALFGTSVEDAFPSASEDISEAGKCRSLGRWTASVMHLMRALEVGLGALAAHRGVPPGENWNTVLNQIEASLRQVSKKTEGVEAEQWAAEAGTHLRFIKNAWRNHAMHPREHYSEERATAIFDNTRSFMQHLAQRLGE